jgi:hypothetical protein
MMINAATNTIIKKATEPAIIPANAPVERPPLSPLSSSDELVGLTLGIDEGKYFRTAWSLSSPAFTVGRAVGAVGVSTVTAVVL